jgi:hypothetical protein
VCGLSVEAIAAIEEGGKVDRASYAAIVTALAV